MLKNYFKIAIAVLKRRKFFTFISLFGISFTLTILIVLVAFIDKVVNDNYPDRQRDQSLYVTKLKHYLKDGAQSISSFSYYFLDHYLKEMKTPDKVAISSNNRPTNTYVNSKKLVLNIKYTNATFWDVLNYQFLEGGGYTERQIQNGEKVAVIPESTKKEYFGNIQTAVGQYITVDNVKYRVIGVTKDVQANSSLFFGDIYMPYIFDNSDYRERIVNGNYIAVLLARSRSELPAMQAEYASLIKRISDTNNDGTSIYSRAESYVNSLVSTGNENDSKFSGLVGGIILFAFLFMLLPAINLININLTRIMERSSEIGVRKAFGASSRALVYQFIVENIVLTLIGGVIGLVFSYTIIQLFNTSDVISNLDLSFNFTVLFYSLLVCLFFGLLSGVYPAWRMSRMNVVRALRMQ